MPGGVPLDRQWIFVLMDGATVFDWGDGLAQDLLNGAFLPFVRNELCHPIRDDELEVLKRAGRVERYDSQRVYVYNLPEPPRQTLE